MPNKGSVPRFPGIPTVEDGSGAIASVETRISEIAYVYPITPSTTMAATFQAAVADGRRNLWDTPLRFIELESEHSSASSAEGAALAGARVTNFTAGQGLVLMKEVLFVISGKRLPVVFHIGARALTSQALNIHAGHDDVMAVADAGWGILFARNAQEAADLTAIARRVAEATEVPYFVVQDGFLTTHTMETMRLPEDELLRQFVGDPRDHIRRWFDPTEPLMTGVVQNQDSYMKGRIGQRSFYDRVPAELDAAFAEWGDLTGRRYGGIERYRTEDATEIVVAMGTIADTATAVVDRLRSEGRAVGCVAVTSFRPFPAAALWGALAHARAVAVIERTDEPAAHDNPLTRELKAALFDHAAEGLAVPRVRSVSAGLGSRDVGPGDLAAVFDWIADHDAPPEQRYATLGIRHPLALQPRPMDLRTPKSFSLRGHSIGRIRVGDDQQARRIPGRWPVRPAGAGLPALRIARRRGCPRRTTCPSLRSRSTSTVNSPRSTSWCSTTSRPSARVIPCAAWSMAGRSSWPPPRRIQRPSGHAIPIEARTQMLARGIRLTALDTAALARSRAPRPDLAIRMQGVALVGAFLRLAPFAARAGLGRDELLSAVRPQLERFFGKRGGTVVDANFEDRGSGVRRCRRCDRGGHGGRPGRATRPGHPGGADMTAIDRQPRTVGVLMTRDPIVVGVETPLAEARRPDGLLPDQRSAGRRLERSPGRRHQPGGPASRSDDRGPVAGLAGPRRPAPDDADRPCRSHPTASFEEAAKLMEQLHIHRVVVVDVDGETPIGLLSISDLVRVIAEEGPE